ncbi:MAG: hypothetical protein ACJZ8I_01215 [Paracoccaceae bacterium]
MSISIKIINLISSALDDSNISITSTNENVSGWDSLGHLSILSALDDATDGKVSGIRDFNDVSTVSQIVKLFEKHNLNL